MEPMSNIGECTYHGDSVAAIETSIIVVPKNINKTTT